MNLPNDPQKAFQSFFGLKKPEQKPLVNIAPAIETKPAYLVGSGTTRTTTASIPILKTNQKPAMDQAQFDNIVRNNFSSGQFDQPQTTLPKAIGGATEAIARFAAPKSTEKAKTAKGAFNQVIAGASIPLEAVQRGILQPASRLGTQLVRNIASGGNDQSFTPKTAFSQFFLGSEEIKPIDRELAEIPAMGDELAKQLPSVKIAGENSTTGKIARLGFSSPLGIVAGGLKALDIDFGTGTAAKKVATEAIEKFGKEAVEKLGKEAFEKLVKEGKEPLERALIEAAQSSPNGIFNPERYVAEMTGAREAARIGEKPGAVQKTKDALLKLKSDFVDSNAPITDALERASKDGNFSILPKNDINLQIDRVYRAPQLAGQFVQDNGLADVIKSVDSLDNLEQYMIAKQAKRLAENGIETGRNLAKDDQLIGAFSPRYEAQAQAVNQYSRKLLDYSVESGLVSRELADRLVKEYPDYVPMERIFSESEDVFRGTPGSQATASLSRQTVVRKIVGSKREVESPFASLLGRTQDAFVQGERNKAAQMLTSYHELPNNPMELRPLRTAERVEGRKKLFDELSSLRDEKDRIRESLSIVGERDKKALQKLDQLQKEIDAFSQEAITVFSSQEGEEPVRLLGQLKEKTNATHTLKALDKRATLLDLGLENRAAGVRVPEPQVSLSFENSGPTAKEAIKKNILTKPNSKVEVLKSRISAREQKLDAVAESKAVLEEQLNQLLKTWEQKKEQLSNAVGELHSLRDTRKGMNDVTINVFRNGIKEVWATAPEIASAAKNWDVQQLNLLGKVLAVPTRVFKLGTTSLNPSFIAANFLRDQQSAAILGDLGRSGTVASPVNFFKALLTATKGGKYYDEAVRAAAMGKQIDIYRSAPIQTVKQLRSMRSVVTRGAYMVTHPSELLRKAEDIINISEETTRLQQFQVSMKKLLAEGRTKEDALLLAAKAARENTVNFARRGNYGRVLSSTIPYLNAQIQGTRSFLRVATKDPKAAAARIAVTLMMPAAAITAWNLSDPKRKAAFEEIQDYEKDGNFIILPPDPIKNEKGSYDNVIKIPMTKEAGAMIAPLRKLLESTQGLPGPGFSDIANALLGTVSPVQIDVNAPERILSTVTPQLIKPALETYTNKNFFTGAPVVPAKLERLPASAQSDARTSALAKKVGEILNVSPKKIDHLVRGYFGGLGGIISGQENVSGSFERRFNSAQGGKKEDAFWEDFNKAKEAQDLKRYQNSDAAGRLAHELSMLPKEEANKRFAEVWKTDQAAGERVLKVIEESKKGIDATDRAMRGLGVEDGSRAKFIVDQINKNYESKEEKNAYFLELWDKKIITQPVYEQMVELLKRQKAASGK